MVIYFYTKNDLYGCFSNFSPHPIFLDDKYWKTTEHYFQAQKFLDLEYQEKIRKAYTPKEAATMGRSRKYKIRDDWEMVKDDIMFKCVSKKFEVHLELQQILLATKEEKIVENAPGDYYWGCGADGSGKNMLGKILVRVREVLKDVPN